MDCWGKNQIFFFLVWEEGEPTKIEGAPPWQHFDTINVTLPTPDALIAALLLSLQRLA